MNKKISIVTAAVFCVILFGFALTFLILPDQNFSDAENRSLQKFPKFTVESFLSGSFGSKMNTYFADQFPIRDFLVGVKGRAELMLLKGGNNGVIKGKDGQLAVARFDAYGGAQNTVSDTDGYFTSTVDRGMEAIRSLHDSLAEKTIDFCAVIAPRTIDVASSALSYPTNGSTALRTQVKEALAGLNAPDVISMIEEHYRAGEYVTYRTDHHWTTLGGYYAYCEVMKSFGMEPLAKELFRVEQTEGFYGTTWSKSGLKDVGPDTLELWLLDDEDQYTVTDLDSETSFTGFYNREFLSKKDKYGAFLDGTHNRLLITKNGAEGRELLLVAKDSFANCMIPFLARHFDILILNLSGDGDETNISKYVENYACDRVLMVYGLENIITSPRLGKVK
ncbi:MAG: DHHW family protein [Clostridia bacterium]|nr:DHHW family protein [Clostridia bacterium]